jgi:hypothetical protein
MVTSLSEGATNQRRETRPDATTVKRLELHGATDQQRGETRRQSAHTATGSLAAASSAIGTVEIPPEILMSRTFSRQGIGS